MYNLLLHCCKKVVLIIFTHLVIIMILYIRAIQMQSTYSIIQVLQMYILCILIYAIVDYIRLHNCIAYEKEL